MVSELLSTPRPDSRMNNNTTTEELGPNSLTLRGVIRVDCRVWAVERTGALLCRSPLARTHRRARQMEAVLDCGVQSSTTGPDPAQFCGMSAYRGGPTPPP